MKVVFIGAGNLATNLSKALKGAGHEVVQVYSRTEESAKTLADVLGCGHTTSLDDVRSDADVYIFSVKDSVLEQLARSLSEQLKDKFFVHTAGSMPMDVLPTKRRGVLYPMQSFSKSRTVDFSVIPTFIEANSEDDLKVLKTLAESISKSVYVLDTERRKYLHLSAVFCCNFVNHCYRLGEKVLEMAMSEGQRTTNNGQQTTDGGQQTTDGGTQIPFNVMLPLIDETARKVHELSPADAQTGPAIRWDENVIQKQMDLLSTEPDLKQIYDMMSRSIHRTDFNS